MSNEYYRKEEMLNIAKEKNIDEKYFDVFVNFMEKAMMEMIFEGEEDENKIKKSSIDFAVYLFDKFYKEIQKGHSKEWSMAIVKAEHSLL